FDMLSELEAALEGAAGNALVQERGLGPVRDLITLAADGEHAVLHVNRQVLLGKAGNGQGDAIIVLIGPLDIVGRVALLAGGFQQVDQPVEADGGTEKGRIIDTHETTSSKRCPKARQTIPAGWTGPMAAADSRYLGEQKTASRPFRGLEKEA